MSADPRPVSFGTTPSGRPRVFVGGIQVYGERAKQYLKTRSAPLGLKNAGVKKPPKTPKTKTVKVNGENENSNENKAGGEGLFIAGNKRIKKKTGKRLFISGAMVTRPKASINRATFQLQALFSAPGFQSYSGSELETRAIEIAARNKGVHVIKFDRSGDHVMHPGAQIFGLRQETFIFKPRFSLEYLKEASEAGSTNKDTGMKELLAACARSKSKGKNHVETDLIEYSPGPRPVIKLYELKIGEGKPEPFPAEAYQLLKCKRLLELEAMRLGIERPYIKCYFLAWFFGIHPVSGMLEAADVKFADHVQYSPRIHNLLSNYGTNNWDVIKKLTPAKFEEETDLDARIVTGQLIRNRMNTFKNIRKVLATRERKYIIWRNISPGARRAINRQRRLVSGPAARRAVPLGNLSKLQEGQWGDFIRQWTPESSYSEMNSIQEKKAKRDAWKNSFAREFKQAVYNLQKSGYIKITTGRTPVNANATNLSSSASNWSPGKNRRGGVIRNRGANINKIKIILQYISSPEKFGSAARGYMTAPNGSPRTIRPVPNTLTADEISKIRTDTASQREWLTGFGAPRVTSAERAQAMEEDPELRNLLAQSAALA
jgi:hypothetical protein